MGRARHWGRARRQWSVCHALVGVLWLLEARLHVPDCLGLLMAGGVLLWLGVGRGLHVLVARVVDRLRGVAVGQSIVV